MYTPCDDIGPDGLHHCPYGAMYSSDCAYYCPQNEEPEDYPDLEDDDDEDN